MRLKDRVAIVTAAARHRQRYCSCLRARRCARRRQRRRSGNGQDDSRGRGQDRGKKSRNSDRCRQIDDVKKLIAGTIDQFGRIDIVVNNAMKIFPGKLEELPSSPWDATMTSGSRALFLVSQGAARHMIKQSRAVS